MRISFRRAMLFLHPTGFSPCPLRYGNSCFLPTRCDHHGTSPCTWLGGRRAIQAPKCKSLGRATGFILHSLCLHSSNDCGHCKSQSREKSASVLFPSCAPPTSTLYEPCNSQGLSKSQLHQAIALGEAKERCVTVTVTAPSHQSTFAVPLFLGPLESPNEGQLSDFTAVRWRWAKHQSPYWLHGVLLFHVVCFHFFIVNIQSELGKDAFQMLPEQ